MKISLYFLGSMFSFLALLPAGNASELLLFDPKGPVGAQQESLIIFSFLAMMVIVVPVFSMIIVFAIRYSKSSKNAQYQPDWSHSTFIETVVWTVPLLIIIVLGTVTYQTSHSLDPRKPLEPEKPPLRIHVVALDWKWLFIYPEQEIASVNEVAIPVNQPVEFLITSDTVMNSFFIPQLGSQIYAMAGMENQLHLIASEPGSYRGLSANYSGFGFSGMKFDAIAKQSDDFEQWIKHIRENSAALTDARYRSLSEKSKDHPVEYFSPVNPLLFNDIILRYAAFRNGKQSNDSN